eukprot:GHVU01233602.1.p1 GENE.GHVU01233602.1~~GHVU01233602.1.p1  ORF type:complete len:116 (-),score=17.54 GHVU01233602.1:61-408(-)
MFYPEIKGVDFVGVWDSEAEKNRISEALVEKAREAGLKVEIFTSWDESFRLRRAVELEVFVRNEVFGKVELGPVQFLISDGDDWDWFVIGKNVKCRITDIVETGNNREEWRDLYC